MSGAALFFIFLATLIIFSIIFDFWIYLAIIGAIVLGIIIAIAVKDSREETAIRRARTRSFSPSWSSSKKTYAAERSLRSKIEDEWNRQELDDAEDLR